MFLFKKFRKYKNKSTFKISRQFEKKLEKLLNFANSYNYYINYVMSDKCKEKIDIDLGVPYLECMSRLLINIYKIKGNLIKTKTTYEISYERTIEKIIDAINDSGKEIEIEESTE
jgi:hypothetical protein